MMECKYRDILAIHEWTDKYADDEDKKLIGKQLSILQTAYFTPSQANWSYKVGLVMVGNRTYEVVTVFGEIRAVRLTSLPQYNLNVLKENR